MIRHSFKADSDSETRKMAIVIEKFIPQTKFTLKAGHFGLEINCNFDNEEKKDLFIATFNKIIGIGEDEKYIQFKLPKD